jgi:hypothetical protein
MGKEMERDIKDIMRRLGEVINETLQESEKIQQILHEVEEKGYALNLSLAVLMGLGKGREGSPRQKKAPDAEREGPDHRPTAFDRKFLRALKLRLPDEGEGGGR